MTQALLAVFAVVVGSACGSFGAGGGVGGDGGLLDETLGDDTGGEDNDDGSLELSCEANPAAVTVEGGVAPLVQLTVLRQDIDGSLEPVQGIEWTILADFGGTIDSTDQYAPPTTHGGRVEIEARTEGLLGLCVVEVYLEIEEVDTPGAPVDAALLDLGATADDDCGPDLLYPLNGSVLASDLGIATFQWAAPTEQDVFVLTIETAFTSVKVLTLEDSWTPDASHWSALSHPAGEEELIVSVSGGLLNSAGSGVVSGLCRDAVPSYSELSEFGVAGTVYYWSPATSGLWSLGVGADVAQPWIGNDSTGYCVGCHTVNPTNPDRMSMVYGGGNGWAVAMEVSAPDSPLLAPEIRPGNFTTMSPDGSRLLRSFEGDLYLDNLETNSVIATIPVTGHATHVDWSPDGSRVVYASCSNANDNYDWQVWGCEIRSMDVLQNDQFGVETVIVPADPDWNYYYPTVSPDGNWLAFNRHAGGDPEQTAYANANAQLMLVSLWGGDPILLSEASQPGQTNSWPRWGPAEADFAWLTYSSKRPYGTTSHNVSQIWLTAINFNDAVQGLDPSAAPMWLPSQDPQIGNHRPVWVPRY